MFRHPCIAACTKAAGDLCNLGVFCAFYNKDRASDVVLSCYGPNVCVYSSCLRYEF